MLKTSSDAEQICLKCREDTFHQLRTNQLKCCVIKLLWNNLNDRCTSFISIYIYINYTNTDIRLQNDRISKDVTEIQLQRVYNAYSECIC